MMVVFRLLRVAKSENGFNYIVLRISLARIDYVVNCIYTPKMGMVEGCSMGNKEREGA